MEGRVGTRREMKKKAGESPAFFISCETFGASFSCLAPRACLYFFVVSVVVVVVVDEAAGAVVVVVVADVVSVVVVDGAGVTTVVELEVVGAGVVSAGFTSTLVLGAGVTSVLVQPAAASARATAAVM